MIHVMLVLFLPLLYIIAEDNLILFRAEVFVFSLLPTPSAMGVTMLRRHVSLSAASICCSTGSE